MNALVKICGLSTPESMTDAIEAGADYIGLVFYPPSPRHVEVEVAKYLASFTPDLIELVGLFVDPDDAMIASVLSQVPLTMIQLHGNESAERVSAVKKTFNIPVMKALSIETAEDLVAAKEFDAVADWLLFDAKPAALPGGNGEAFDWDLLKGYRGARPWMLAGGLTPENVAGAIASTRAHCVDVSSGVEGATGVKDGYKIRSFIQAAKGA